MKKIALFLLMISAYCPLAFSQCFPGSSVIYTFAANGNVYEIVKANATWKAAAACAVARGGILAEIRSKAQQDSLFQYIKMAGIIESNTTAPDGGGASYLWIGANDMQGEDSWVWDGDNNGNSTQFWLGDANGLVVGGAYTNWGTEPDDYQGQDALALAITDWPKGLAGQWNDVDQDNQLYYVVERTGLNAVNEIQAITFSIYPNPAAESLTVKVKSVFVGSAFSITDPLGRSIMTGKLTGENTNIDIKELSAGIYMLNIGGQNPQTFKVEKK